MKLSRHDIIVMLSIVFYLYILILFTDFGPEFLRLSVNLRVFLIKVTQVFFSSFCVFGVWGDSSPVHGSHSFLSKTLEKHAVGVLFA